MKKMAKLFFVLNVILLLGFQGVVGATTFTFDGTINYHNDVVFFNFSLLEDATFEIWTDSYNDGENFDPIIALWHADGTLIGHIDDYPYIRSADQTEYDSGLALSSFDAGDYLLSIASVVGSDLNLALGPTLAEGFYFDNMDPIPIENYGVGYYRVNFSGVSDAVPTPVPEPGILLLFGAGLLGIGAYCRFRK